MKPNRKLIINKTQKIKNKNLLVREFLKYKPKNKTVETKNAIIKKINTSLLNTNYYSLQSKSNGKQYFIKEIKNPELLTLGQHGYNEYLALKNKTFINTASKLGFEIIEPHIGFVDHKKKTSFIVTPFKKELKTVDQAFKDKKISKKKYLELRDISKKITLELKNKDLQIGDINTHNIFIDPKDLSKKPIIFDPWYIPKEQRIKN